MDRKNICNQSYSICLIKCCFQHWVGEITAIIPLTSAPGITSTSLLLHKPPTASLNWPSSERQLNQTLFNVNHHRESLLLLVGLELWPPSEWHTRSILMYLLIHAIYSVFPVKKNWKENKFMHMMNKHKLLHNYKMYS